jgi:hypothetical protein
MTCDEPDKVTRSGGGGGEWEAMKNP